MRTRKRLMVRCAALIIAALFPTTMHVEARWAGRVQQSESQIQSVKVTVTGEGFKPASIALRQDVPARVTFLREVEETCAKEVVIPEYKIKRELPLNEPVMVEFTPQKSGEFAFTCGMGMLRGKVVVQEK